VDIKEETFMTNSSLDISVETFKRVALVEVSGRIDSSTAPEFEEALQGVTGDGRHNIVVDLSGVDYMSSAGLRILVATLRECKKRLGNVKLANPSERASDVLSLAGLDTMFDIYDDRTAAVGSF
jgi:anti-sigma B factor antagonist